ncbi:hypothetical protein, partial [Anoxybacillus sp. LAT_11]|uniref:hypothetical protein n=1 Tax=Anoxybacillus sp. LAT_11 TaxID=2862718 RepID=UPI001EEAF37E
HTSHFEKTRPLQAGLPMGFVPLVNQNLFKFSVSAHDQAAATRCRFSAKEGYDGIIADVYRTKE